MNSHQRKLLILPILHTKEDMGSLGNHLALADGYTAMVSEFWQEVKKRVKQYVNGFIRVKIYQDGLPDTQKELVEKILSEVQSPNYELLRFLKEKGAKILGTEDHELLKKEYQFITRILGEQDEVKKNKQSLIPRKLENKQSLIPRKLENKQSLILAKARNKLKQAYENQAGELLTKRDTYIASRIDKTLNSGELGILFIGAAHAIEAKLPADIQVETL